MARFDRIFLVGPMGAGKSTIGRLLSEELNLPFIDSDKIIEDKAGANIPWIFDLEGEGGFREREEQAIDELTAGDASVLATGGGAILRESNRKFLRSRGFVVYLETSVDHQLKRTQKDKNRPLLQTADPKKTLTDLLEIRGPLYEQTADWTVTTDGLSPKAVVQNIIEHFSSQE